MPDIPPISDIQRQIALQKQDRSRKRYTNRKPSEGKDSIFTSSSLAAIQEHAQELASMDEVRPEMVELGKKLAKSKDFPSAANLDKLAEALLSPIDELE